MPRYTIDLDLSKCVSCYACMVACMDQNDISTEQGQKPFRNVFDLETRNGERVNYSHLSLACMHCPDASCIVACPCACIKKDPETNLTIFDTTNCIGCHSCAMACPFGIPAFGTDGKMQKCDGCFVRVHQGLKPACVKACPVSALRLVELDLEKAIPEKVSLQKSSVEILEKQV